MIDAPEIKILRLITGEDIIASCLFDNESESIIVDNPMKIALSRTISSKSALLILVPWLPVEILEIDSTFIHNNDVLAVLMPRKSTAEYYSNLVEKFENMDSSQDILKEGMEEQDVDEQESEIDEMMQIEEMLLNAASQKKTTYH